MKIATNIFITVLLFYCTNNTINKNLDQMDIKYAYTILYVEDVTKTIDFYQTVFGFEKKFLTPENDYGEIMSGETTIAFASIQLGNSNLKSGFTESKIDRKPFGIELAFTTENVEASMEQAIKEGGKELEAVVQKPWGQKVGYVTDVNGFLLEICTPVKTED